MANTVAPIIDDLLKKERHDSLNKRVNLKGNYENYITGGSHALDNQAFHDKNEYARAMANPNSGWANEPWVDGLNDRYTNPEHNRNAGNAPFNSGLNYIHGYTPSTRRGRRLQDVYFYEKASGKKDHTNDDREKVVEKINKYERMK